MAKHSIGGSRLPSPAVGDRPGTAGAAREAEALDLRRLAVDYSPDSVLVLDARHRVLFANRAFPGMSAGPMLGRNLLECVPSAWRQTIRSRFEEATASGESRRFELELAGLTPPSASLECRVEPVRGPGEVDLLVVNVTEVTARKELERTLRLSAERYRFLTETISDVIWTMNLDQRITYVSPSIKPLIDYTVEETQRRELRDILAPESFALAREILLEELRIDSHREVNPTRTRTLDIKLVRRDGSTVWCEAKMSFLRDSRGRPSGVLGVARDISSWRDAQEALVASEERLRRAQRLEAVGQLAGGVAHDFNNLLTVIIGNIELMLKELPKEDFLRSQALEVSKAADRAASLTRQLLAFSRKQMMLPRTLSLNLVVEEMAGMLRGLIGESVELKLDLYPAIGTVKADPSQIELVLVNLVLNARDAMPDGGRLVIETANAHLDPSSGSPDFIVVEGPYVMLAVSDTGSGIDPEDQAKIFEPFFTTKDVGKGTGLGLSTVYGIVKQSGGYIWVTSRPGHGSRFEIYLPRSQAAETHSGAEPERQDHGSGRETVLVVEDEDGVRTLTQRILQEAGYRVLVADRAESALEVLRDLDRSIDLLLTDVVMPGISGARLVERARSLRPTLRALFISGHSDDILSRYGQLLESSVELLPKPFTPETLIRSIRSVLDAPQE